MQHLTEAVHKVGEAHKALHHHHRETVRTHHPHHHREAAGTLPASPSASGAKP